MKQIYRAVLFLGLAAVTGVGQAITLGFDSAAQTVGVGASVQVSLNISGLGDGAAPSLGTFDLDIAYDPGVLSLTDVSFGDSVLGDQLDLFSLGSITSSGSATAGTLNVFELSLDDPADLDALQASAFTLATLSFSAISPGSSTLGISINALGDAYGDPLLADTLGASVTVSAVPLPAALWLFSTGLIGLVGVVRR